MKKGKKFHIVLVVIIAISVLACPIVAKFVSSDFYNELKKDDIDISFKPKAEKKKYKRNTKVDKINIDEVKNLVASKKADISFLTKTLSNKEIYNTILKDGVYRGISYNTYAGVPLVVEVGIKNSKIAYINVISNAETPRYMMAANRVIKSIVDNQRVRVDTVSGATISSAAIMDAVNNALSKARINRVNNSKKLGQEDLSELIKKTSHIIEDTRNKKPAFTQDQYDAEAYLDKLIIDVDSAEDGVYIGEALGFVDSIRLRVVVKNHQIVSIEYLKFEDAPEYMTPSDRKLLETEIKANPNSIDGVSGATYSSNGIKRAVKYALKDYKGTSIKELQIVDTPLYKLFSNIYEETASKEIVGFLNEELSKSYLKIFIDNKPAINLSYRGGFKLGNKKDNILLSVYEKNNEKQTLNTSLSVPKSEFVSEVKAKEIMDKLKDNEETYKKLKERDDIEIGIKEESGLFEPSIESLEVEPNKYGGIEVVESYKITSLSNYDIKLGASIRLKLKAGLDRNQLVVIKEIEDNAKYMSIPVNVGHDSLTFFIDSYGTYSLAKIKLDDSIEKSIVKEDPFNVLKLEIASLKELTNNYRIIPPLPNTIYKDGIYTGYGYGYHYEDSNNKISTTLTIKDNKIASINSIVIKDGDEYYTEKTLSYQNKLKTNLYKDINKLIEDHVSLEKWYPMIKSFIPKYKGYEKRVNFGDRLAHLKENDAITGATATVTGISRSIMNGLKQAIK